MLESCPPLPGAGQSVLGIVFFTRWVSHHIVEMVKWGGFFISIFGVRARAKAAARGRGWKSAAGRRPFPAAPPLRGATEPHRATHPARHLATPVLARSVALRR